LFVGKDQDNGIAQLVLVELIIKKKINKKI